MLLQIPEEWTNDDAVHARDFFLRTSTGQKFISIMKASMPKIEGRDRDERYDASLKMQTWNECVDSMTQLIQVNIDADDGGELEPVDFSTVSNKKFAGDPRYIPKPPEKPQPVQSNGKDS